MHKCKLAVCDCPVEADDQFCSQYCREAAEQAPEREFCQCAHAGCTQHVRNETFDTEGLPSSIMFTPGSVTIEYADERDLCDQLILLAGRLYRDSAAVPERMRPSRKQPGISTLEQSA